MNQYEVMYVIDTAIDETARTNLISRFSDLVVKNGGKVDRVDEWGKRRLAYPVNDLMEGYYVLMTMDAKPEFPAELDRVFKITEGVMRSLITDVEV